LRHTFRKILLQGGIHLDTNGMNQKNMSVRRNISLGSKWNKHSWCERDNSSGEDKQRRLQCGMEIEDVLSETSGL